MYVTLFVSVPFRGISFPNLLAVNNRKPQKKVSVPFRGISFPNLPESVDLSGNIGFRPLPGHLISKFVGEKADIKAVYKVSVPFRGISFPNGKWL